jgi:hypothetical protein
VPEENKSKSSILQTIGSIVGILGGIAGLIAFVNTFFYEKEDYSISVTSCSEKGPEKAFIENMDTKYRVEVPVSQFPVALERVTNIKNNGKKTINDQDIHIAINDKGEAHIRQTTVFYESALSKHELISDSSGRTFRIKLKNFNPKDQISVLISSDRSVGLDVMSKGEGYTLDSHYKSSESCAPFSRMSYGGIIAFNKVSDECELDKTNLSLHCNLTQSFKLPEGIPPGRARLFFK